MQAQVRLQGIGNICRSASQKQVRRPKSAQRGATFSSPGFAGFAAQWPRA